MTPAGFWRDCCGGLHRIIHHVGHIKRSLTHVVVAGACRCPPAILKGAALVPLALLPPVIPSAHAPAPVAPATWDWPDVGGSGTGDDWMPQSVIQSVPSPMEASVPLPIIGLGAGGYSGYVGGVPFAPERARDFGYHDRDFSGGGIVGGARNYVVPTVDEPASLPVLLVAAGMTIGVIRRRR